MGRKTGKPRGRPIGAKNKRTAELHAEVAQVAASIAHTVPNAFPGDAHAYLMRVYKDPAKADNLRIDAAKAAVQYEKPKLATTDIKHSGEISQTVRFVVENAPVMIEAVAE